MADLIDRAELLAEIQHDIETSGCVNHERDMLDSIRYAPAVDAVKVVRCKDCISAQRRYGHLECLDGVCYRNTWNDPDFYCGKGRRKGERYEAD